jgi:YD repeat-containing protein
MVATERMVQSMTKTILMLSLAVLTGAASAQSQTLYDANGKVVGRSATDGRTTTLYDANGKVVIRESTTGNTTTIYDASGRNVGRYSANPKR